MQVHAPASKILYPKPGRRQSPFPVIDAVKQSRANKEDLVFAENLFHTVLLMAERCCKSVPKKHPLSCDVAGSDVVRAGRCGEEGATKAQPWQCSGQFYLLRFLLLSGDPAVLSISIAIGVPIS